MKLLINEDFCNIKSLIISLLGNSPLRYFTFQWENEQIEVSWASGSGEF